MMQEQAYQESLVHEKASLEKTIEALAQERVQQQVECDLMQKKSFVVEAGCCICSKRTCYRRWSMYRSSDFSSTYC